MCLLGHHTVGNLHQLEEGLVVDESVRCNLPEVVFEDVGQDKNSLTGLPRQSGALVLQLNSQRLGHSLDEAHDFLHGIQVRRDNDRLDQANGGQSHLPVFGYLNRNSS